MIQTNPIGPTNGDYHVCRGGNYQINDARYCRVSFRCGTALASTIPGLGLRLALKVD